MIFSVKFALGILAGVLLVVGGRPTASAGWSALGRAVGPTCSVGVTGLSVKVELAGWSAPAHCVDLTVAPLSYSFHGEPDGQAVCAYQWDQDEVRVFDEGPVHPEASALCASLRSAGSIRSALLQLSSHLPVPVPGFNAAAP